MKSRTVRKVNRPKSLLRTHKVRSPAPASMAKLQGEPPLEVNRRRAFNLKPAKTIRPHRRGTARAMVVDLLGKGSSLSQVMKLTGWTYRQAVEGIRLVNKHLGYGVREDDEGNINLVRPRKQ